MYRRVMAIDVFLWGHHVGRIAPDFGSYYQFQYDPDFIRTGIQIAPIKMPLREQIYKAVDFDLQKGAFRGLPGVFADSLPDAFGNALVDKWMEDHKTPKSMVSTLDRLAYVGSRGMGALTYEPETGPGRLVPTALDMRHLVEEARLAERQGLAAGGFGDQIAALFSQAGLPVALPDGLRFDDLVPVMMHDKKNSQGRIRYALPFAMGDVRLT